MPSLDTSQGSLYYAETGKDSPHALILIHGAAASHLIWPGALRHMDGYRVITPDLPGHGRSPAPGRQAVADYAACILALMDALHIEKAVFGGHSMGGAITQTLALDHPQRCAGIILIGTGARLWVSPQIIENARQQPEAAFQAINRWQWSPNAPEDWRQRGLEELRAVPPDILAGDYSACNGFDVSARLGEISVSALIIGGEIDKMTPFSLSENLAAGIPGAHLVQVERGGHMMILEQSQIIGEAVKNWLQGASLTW